jgi:hypothetical protein
MGFGALDSPQRNAGQLENCKNIAVTEFIGQGDADHIKIT